MSPAEGSSQSTAAQIIANLNLTPTRTVLANGSNVVYANTEVEAIRNALAGSVEVTFAGQSHAYVPTVDRIGVNQADHSPFLLSGSNGQYNLGLEDLTDFTLPGTPPDWDYNDVLWGIAVAPVVAPPVVGPPRIPPGDGPSLPGPIQIIADPIIDPTVPPPPGVPPTVPPPGTVSPPAVPPPGVPPVVPPTVPLPPPIVVIPPQPGPYPDPISPPPVVPPTVPPTIPPLPVPPTVPPPPAVLGSIHGTVWNDGSNGDGIQQSSEDKLNGVAVWLYSNSSGSYLQQTWTNNVGEYEFKDLQAGAYRVAFQAPSAVAFTLFHQGTNDQIDSDVSVADTNGVGWTNAIPLNAGAMNQRFIGAGMQIKADAKSYEYRLEKSVETTTELQNGKAVEITWVYENKYEMEKGKPDKKIGDGVKIGYEGTRTKMIFRDIQLVTAAADRIYGDATYDQLVALQKAKPGRDEKGWATAFKDQVAENVKAQKALLIEWRKVQSDPAKLKVFTAANPKFQPYRGGRHGFTAADGAVNDLLDSHHTPAKKVYLKVADYDLGPAIQMEKPDHFKTSSYGAQAGNAYYDKQDKFINTDKKLWEAIKMDLKDVPEAAGTPAVPKDIYKYALDEMLDSIYTVKEWRGPLVK